MKLFLLCFAVLTTAADIDMLRLNVTNYLTGAGADTNNVIVAQSLTDLETEARTLMTSVLPRGGWIDINYALPLAIGGEWQAIKHYECMRQMAIAYCTRGHGLYNSDSLKNAMELALDSIHDHVYYGVNRVNNWWYWFQGIPMYYGQTLLLMQGKIDSALHSQAVTTLKWCLDNPEYYSNPGDMVTQGLGFLYHGIIANNTTSLNRAKTLAQGELTVRNSVGDGILADFSCVHHMDQLYIGGYGAQVAADGPKYHLFTSGTQYALNQPYFDAITSFNAEGTAWSLCNNYYDISVIGRNVTRASQVSNSTYGLTAMLLMSAQVGERRTLFQKASKKMVETWDIPLPIEIAAYASSVLNEPVTPSWPIGHKNFWMTNFTVHKRPDYHLSVKMMGPGISGSEYVNNEGKKSWHLSDGMTYILRKGDEYNRNNVIPTLDWNRLPGITVQKKYYSQGEGHSNPKGFVGGVTCCAYGTSAMDFASSGESVTAKKSWFFFDKEMVCLGSNINCPTNDTVETIINQRPLPTPTEPLIVNGNIVSSSLGWSGKLDASSWVFYDSIGYYFPGGADIYGKMANQSGRWRDIGVGDTVLRTNPFTSIWFNHGINVSNASYAYAVLPNKNISEMALYAASPEFTVLENSDTLHAVSHNALRSVSAVFWKPGEVDIIKSDSPSIVFCRETNDSFYFSAAYPPRKAVDISFTIDRPLTLISSSISVTVSTDSIKTNIRYRSPGNGNGIDATFRKIHKSFAYVKLTVIDSADGKHLKNVLCVVRKDWPNSGYTNDSGIVIIKADTGFNTVTASLPSYGTQSYDSIHLTANDSFAIRFAMKRLENIGGVIFPDNAILAFLDTMQLSFLSLFSDSSTQPAVPPLFWSLTPSDIASISSNGLLTTALSEGFITVQCSSGVTNHKAQTVFQIKPIYRIKPVSDAFVRGGSYGNDNYGSDSTLVIKNNGDGTYTRKCFIKFDLSSIRHLNVDSAFLHIYAGEASSSKVSVYAVDNDSWNENTITWNSAPSFGSILDTIRLVSTTVWKKADLGGFASQQFTSDKTISLALFNDYPDDLFSSFKSKESSVHKPYIEVYANTPVVTENSFAVNKFSIAVLPNPFNPSTTISVHGLNDLQKNVSLSIISTNGVKVFGKKIRSSGNTVNLVWDASKAASGVYIICVKYANKTLRKKLTLLK